MSALSISISLAIKNDPSQQESLNKGIQLNKCHQTAAMLIDCSEELLQRYERIRQGMLGVTKPSNPDKEWASDCQKLHALFDTQESRTKQQINRLLSEESSSIGDLRTGDINRSISKDIWTAFAKEGGAVKEDIEGANEKAWNEMAGRAQSDIRRLMRHIEES